MNRIIAAKILGPFSFSSGDGLTFATNIESMSKKERRHKRMLVYRLRAGSLIASPTLANNTSVSAASRLAGEGGEGRAHVFILLARCHSFRC